MENFRYKGRYPYCGLYGNPSDHADYRFVHYDADDHAQQLDGWYGKSLGFLKVIKLPVHEVAMMMSIALRFIPILLEETDKS